MSEDEFEGTVGIVRELDERSSANADLTSIGERHPTVLSVLDEADVGVFVLDDEFNAIWVDETIEEFFGLDQSDIVGRAKRTLIKETIQDRFADPVMFAETLLATYDDNTYVEQFECQITPGSDRERQWLEHRSKPIESGLYTGGRIELYYDITDRKESEQAQRENERQFQSLVDAVEECAIVMLDSEGHIVSWNPGAKQIKGYSSVGTISSHARRRQ